MSNSQCPVPGCGFNTGNPDSFNRHMASHDEDRAAAARQVVADQEAEAKKQEAMLQEEELRDEIAQELEKAKRVVGPFFEAINVLLSDPDARALIITLLKRMFADVAKAAAETEPAKE